MPREIPGKLLYFIKTALQEVEDGYEYASELNRILNADDCQRVLTDKELEAFRDYAGEVKKVGEINHYTEERIKELEIEHFGTRGMLGYLNADHGAPHKPSWPF